MPDTELATITAKGQVTIPKAIRDALNLRQGDQLRWDLDDGGVRLRLVNPLDLTDLRGVEAGLEEWASPEDEEAFADFFKLFSLDERLLLCQLGQLAARDRSGVLANRQRALAREEGTDP